jgi:hypothetical protein
MEIAPPQAIRLLERMSDKGPFWERIVARHGLRPIPYRELVSWGYGDGRLHRHWETLMNTSKIRRHGFLEFVDTEEMFMRIFHDLRERRVIP